MLPPAHLEPEQEAHQRHRDRLQRSRTAPRLLHRPRSMRSTTSVEGQRRWCPRPPRPRLHQRRQRAAPCPGDRAAPRPRAPPPGPSSTPCAARSCLAPARARRRDPHRGRTSPRPRGHTTVPVSRPSRTTPPPTASSRCSGVIFSRTGASAVNCDVRRLISGVRISPLTSRPSTSTRSPTSSTRVRSRTAPRALGSSGSTPEALTAQARAR